MGDIEIDDLNSPSENDHQIEIKDDTKTIEAQSPTTTTSPPLTFKSSYHKHVLTYQLVIYEEIDKGAFYCNRCKKNYPKGTSAYHCDPCQYDLCDACTAKEAKNVALNVQKRFIQNVEQQQQDSTQIVELALLNNELNSLQSIYNKIQQYTLTNGHYFSMVVLFIQFFLNIYNAITNVITLPERNGQVDFDLTRRIVFIYELIVISFSVLTTISLVFWIPIVLYMEKRGARKSGIGMFIVFLKRESNRVASYSVIKHLPSVSALITGTKSSLKRAKLTFGTFKLWYSKSSDVLFGQKEQQEEEEKKVQEILEAQKNKQHISQVDRQLLCWSKYKLCFVCLGVVCCLPLFIFILVLFPFLWFILPAAQILLSCAAFLIKLKFQIIFVFSTSLSYWSYSQWLQLFAFINSVAGIVNHDEISFDTLLSLLFVTGKEDVETQEENQNENTVLHPVIIFPQLIAQSFIEQHGLIKGYWMFVTLDANALASLIKTQKTK